MHVRSENIYIIMYYVCICTIFMCFMYYKRKAVVFGLCSWGSFRCWCVFRSVWSPYRRDMTAEPKYRKYIYYISIYIYFIKFPEICPCTRQCSPISILYFCWGSFWVKDTLYFKLSLRCGTICCADHGWFLNRQRTIVHGIFRWNK